MTILELLIQNGHAPGTYFNVCRECKAKFIGDKRAITCLECASKRVGNVAEPNAHSVLSEVRAFLEKNRMRHYECEDSWYSCPKSEDGCSNDNWGDECNCGADKYNAELDEILKKLSEHFS